MRKKSFHRDHVSLSYNMPCSMINTLPPEYLKENQAELISNATYKDGILQPSSAYERVSGENLFYDKLYNVFLSGKRRLFGSYNGGVRDISDNISYPVESGVTPSDIIYNQDGLFISSSYNIYNIKSSGGPVEKIAFSLSPFEWRKFTGRQSDAVSSNSLIYFGGKMYFCDNRGIGFYKDETGEVTILNAFIVNIDFYICGGVLFGAAENAVYAINDGTVTLYHLKSGDKPSWRHTAVFGSYLIALTADSSGYFVEMFDTVTKKEERRGVLGFTKGLNTAGYKLIRSINNELYLLLNETDWNGAAYSNNKISLYRMIFRNGAFFITKTFFEDIVSDSFLTHIFYAESRLCCMTGMYIGSSSAGGKVKIYETGDNCFNEISFLMPPAAAAFSGTLAFKGDRIYAANHEGVFYVDIRLERTFIPCLLIQNGRLAAPQGSSLYFSGTGDFHNWSYGADSDALFTEIGYKDGGNIIYAVVVMDSIIVFKDNGAIYRLAGGYPLWSVTKLGETDGFTARALQAGGEIIFGAKSGAKKLSVTQNFGDFFISPFQNSVRGDFISSISVKRENGAILFCCKDYVLEYIVSNGIFTVFQNKPYKDCIEMESGGRYDHYALDSNGLLYKASDKNNDVELRFGKIIKGGNIALKAVTVYADITQSDKFMDISFDGGFVHRLILKKGKEKHKFFITRRLEYLQPVVKHAGNFFARSIIIEYSNIGE